jgi:tetratricopeptide (TPR) repeat protein
MPKLSPLQWIIVAAFQAFYGFAVFALTRDYYQRHPPVTVGAGGGRPAPHPAASATPPPAGSLGQPFGAGSTIPEAVAERDPVLLAQLGDERLRQGLYQDAIPLYRRALALAPDDVDTHNDLGLALHYAGDSQQALEVLKQGVEKDPRFQRIWLTLGFVQSQTAERPEAAYAFREAIAIEPGNDIAAEAQRLLDRLGEP